MTPSIETRIREATPDDVPAIVQMGLRFLTSAPYGGLLRPKPEVMAAFALRLIQSDEAVWLVAERQGALIGMLAMFLYAQPFSGQVIATELCWWVEPEARGPRTAIRLLTQGEAWARAKGAELLQMIAPTDHVAAFYERTGFERIEVHYQRALA